MDEIFRLDTRDRTRLLLAMMRVLASGNCRISFEGNLSHTGLAQLIEVVSEESGVLKRATLQPRLDFLVLPLNEENVTAIATAIVSKIAFGQKGILHVQIAIDGKIAFAAYDNFDRECVVAYPPVKSALLDGLVGTQVLRSYKCVSRPPGQP
jgi:hypothetical protein